LPPENRGFFSGLLQEGYVIGNLLAAALFGILFPHLHGSGMMTNWRVMFMIGALPALLAFYLRLRVEESPAWIRARSQGKPDRTRAEWAKMPRYVASFLFLVLLMSAFTSFSHGTQDLYPTFLHDHGLRPSLVGLIAAIGNVGALVGGIVCGAMSERFGRRTTIVCAALLAIPVVPLWAWSHTAAMLAAGGFLMQFMVQGAWGIIPVHLNELSPGPVRAVLPGFAYQLGTLVSSRNVHFQAAAAQSMFGGRLAPVMGWTVVFCAVFIAIVASLGREAHGADLSGAEST